MTEGYATQRSQMLADPQYRASMGIRDDSYIFRTANDVLGSVFSASERGMPRYADTNIHDAQARYGQVPVNSFGEYRKRARDLESETATSVADDDEIHEPTTSDSELDLSDPDEPKMRAPREEEEEQPRQFKPLRKRTMNVTQSLPAGSLQFGVAGDSGLGSVAEEDWKKVDLKDSFDKPPE